MWKSVVICLKPVGLKGGTANFGSLQVKLFFGIHHFLFSLSIWAFLFLYFPNLSQKKKKMSRAVKGYKYQGARSFTWLVSSKVNDYKRIWFLQMSSQPITLPKPLAPPLSPRIHSLLCKWRARRMKMAK